MSFPTDEQVITIKEAAEKYNKAEITIRRLIRQIVKDESHQDRLHIHPTPDQVAKLKRKSKPFTYSVNKVLLEKIYGEVQNVKAAKKKAEEAASVDTNEYFDLLKQQLAVKDDQIRALNQSLDELTVRARETNILMKGMQEKVFQIPVQAALIESPSDKKKNNWWFW